MLLSTAFLTTGTGLVAGGLHVVSGPDHVAALVPIAVEDRGHAVRVGLLWGLGHGLGVGFIGGLGVAAASWFNIEALAEYTDLAVGLLLIGIGIWALWRSRQWKPHDHELGEGQHLHHHAAFGVGLFHGAAGTGHIFGVLPALALPPTQSAIYLSAYLGGAVLSMGGLGYLLGALAGRLSSNALRGLMAGSGLAAFGIGLAWLSSA